MFCREKFRLIILSLIIVTIWGCEKNIPEPNARGLRNLDEEEKAFIDRSNRLAFSFLKSLDRIEPHKNLSFSPLSIGMSMGMIYNGIEWSEKSRIDSLLGFSESGMRVNKTFNELTTLLQKIDENVNISFSNSFWYNRKYSLNDSFRDKIMAYYGAEAEGLNFANAHTPGYIRRIISSRLNQEIQYPDIPIPENCETLLINSVSFSGKWAFPTTGLISDAPFNGSRGGCMFEVAQGAIVQVFQDDFKQIVDIPYGNSQYSMTIVSPHNLQGFAAIRDMDYEDLLVSLEQSEPCRYDVALPLFGSGYRTNQVQFFSDYGISLTPEQLNMGTSMFNDPGPSKIDVALHESYLIPSTSSLHLQPAPYDENVFNGETALVLDKPFLYFIREKHTGIILFAGKFLHPDI